LRVSTHRLGPEHDHATPGHVSLSNLDWTR
jgi:hypothetical protein